MKEIKTMDLIAIIDLSWEMKLNALGITPNDEEGYISFRNNVMKKYKEIANQYTN